MKTLQIRNVPDEIHRKLKARAAIEGRSLSEFALTELRQVIERPSLSELVERAKALEPVDTSESAADAVRAERDGR